MLIRERVARLPHYDSDSAGIEFAPDQSGPSTRKRTGHALVSFAAALLALAPAWMAEAQVIDTVAGGGAALSLDGPRGLAADADGNLFIADEPANLISKLDTSGELTTVAGDGTEGFSGDGGSATSASLALPSDVAVDADGNFFIADRANHRIRRVDAVSGIITTFAGNGTAAFGGDAGPATSASLDSPNGVALDADGNLFISDPGNDRIRRVDAVSGIITTVAGNGIEEFSGDGGAATSAGIFNPADIALDADGNLFISDPGNQRIRRVDAVSGVISTVAGDGNQGSTGDGGLATSASFSFPAGVVLDASNNLFIADQGNQRIRRVDAVSSIITTVAGDGSQGLSGDGGPATSAGLSFPADVVVLDISNDLFIADQGNQRIRRVDAVTGIITTVGVTTGDGGPATDAFLGDPTAAALDGAGNLFISDTGNDRIRRVDSVSGIITTVAGNGVEGFGGDGGPATSASLANPGGIALDTAGNLYFSDPGNQRIRRVDAVSGIITTVVGDGNQGFTGDGGPATSATLSFPGGVALDSGGNLFIADQGNHVIRRVDAVTGIITTVAGDGTQGFTGDGGPATSATLSFPFDVTVDSSDNLFIADQFNHRIRRVDAVSGDITTVAGDGTPAFGGDGGPATLASLDSPSGVALDAAGNLFIADQSNQRVRQVDTSGDIATVAGDGTAGFSGDGGLPTLASLNDPMSVVLGVTGDLFIADKSNDRIRAVTGPGGVCDGVVCTAFDTDCGIASCDLGGAAGNCDTLTARPADTVCRVGSGDSCDLDEVCDGANTGACPLDVFEPATTVCRGTAGVCDIAEQCTGNAGESCPADVFEPATTVCDAGSGDTCDPVDFCDGASATCSDVIAAAGTECRASIGMCDGAEVCSGVDNDACPADIVAVSGTVCNAGSGDICDPDEVCDGDQRRLSSRRGGSSDDRVSRFGRRVRHRRAVHGERGRIVSSRPLRARDDDV